MTKKLCKVTINRKFDGPISYLRRLEEYHRDLTGKKFSFARDTELMLDLINFERVKHGYSFDLVTITMDELGLLDDACSSDIFKKAVEKGLTLCPPEIGLYLLLNHPVLDLEKNEAVNFGMIPIISIVRTDYKKIFNLEYRGSGEIRLGHRLDVETVHIGYDCLKANGPYVWPKWKKWIFVQSLRKVG